MAESRSIFVADASVIAKWASIEPEDLEKALLFKDDFIKGEISIIVTSYCFSEICNLLYFKSPSIALEFFSYLCVSNIIEHQLTLNLANLVFQIMNQYKGISFYDASYHALAIQEKGTFITADEKYFKKTHKEGRIMLLKDYGKKR